MVHVELSIEKKTFSVLRYYMVINRDTDKKGRPISDPVWHLHIAIRHSQETSIANWMIDPDKLFNGTLIVYNGVDGQDKQKEIEFQDSAVVSLVDYSCVAAFMSDISYLVIRGKDIKINSAHFQQRWPGKRQRTMGN